jgi:hypothetical protein
VHVSNNQVHGCIGSPPWIKVRVRVLHIGHEYQEHRHVHLGPYFNFRVPRCTAIYFSGPIPFFQKILTILPEVLEVPYFVWLPLSQWATSRECKKQNALVGTYVSSNMYFFGPKSVIFRKWLKILPEGLQVPSFVSFPLSQWTTSRDCKIKNALVGTYVSSQMCLYSPKYKRVFLLKGSIQKRF